MNATVATAVQHCGVCVLSRAQAREGEAFEVVQNGVDFGVGRLVLRRPCDDTRGVPMLRHERVDQLADQDWITAHHAHLGTHVT